MIGLDTNILARYYIEDKADAEALKQRLAAQRLIESGQPLMVCKTVILEFEGVMRGFYEFSQAQVLSVMNHLLALSHVTIEDKSSVAHALLDCATGISLADALHHASYRSCASMATFDDKKFARKAGKMGLTPQVTLLS